MKSVKIIAILLFSTTSFSFSQKDTNDFHLRNDFGFLLNVPNTVPSFEYRIALNDKYKLRLAAEMSGKHSFPNSGNLVVFASDSLVIQEGYNLSTSEPTLRIGLDRQLPNKPWSLGVDLLARYSNEQTNFFNSGQRLTANGWQSVDFDDALLLTEKKVTNHFVTVALRGNAAINHPLGDSYMLTGYFAAELGPKFFVSETDRVDDLNEIPKMSGYSWKFNSFAGIGIRYMFKADK